MGAGEVSGGAAGEAFQVLGLPSAGSGGPAPGEAIRQDGESAPVRAALREEGVEPHDPAVRLRCIGLGRGRAAVCAVDCSTERDAG